MVADWRSTGAINSGTTAFSGLSGPAGVLAGDILLAQIETDGSATLTPPGTWTAVPGTPISTSNGSASTMYLWWRRAATDGDNTPPNIGTISGLNHYLHRCIAIKECPLTGSPIDVVATEVDTNIDTTTRLPEVTTTVDNCVFVHAMAMGTTQASNTTNRYTSVTTPAGATAYSVKINNGRNNGNGGCIGMWTGRRLTDGVIAATTGVCLDSDSKVAVTVAFKTAPADELPLDLLQQGSSTVDGTGFVSNGSMFGGTDSIVWAGILGTGTSLGVPTLSGLGRTWTLEQDIAINSTVRLFVFKGEGATPTGGTVTITFPATATGCNWAFMRQRGGSGTVVQKPEVSVTNSISTLLNWAAAANAANKQLLFGAVSLQGTNNTVTPESPWVEAVENVRASPAAKLIVWTNPGTFDTATTVTDDGTTYDFAVIGLELDYAAGGSQDQEIPKLTSAASQRTIARSPGVVERTAPRLTAAANQRTIARDPGAVARTAPRLTAAGAQRTIARSPGVVTRTAPRLTAAGVTRTLSLAAGLVERTMPKLTASGVTRTIARTFANTNAIPRLSAAAVIRTIARSTAVDKAIPRLTTSGIVRTFVLSSAISKAIPRLGGTYAGRTLDRSAGSTDRVVVKLSAAGTLRLFGRNTAVSLVIPRQAASGAVRVFGRDAAVDRTLARLAGGSTLRGLATVPGGVGRSIPRQIALGAIRALNVETSGSSSRELPRLVADLEGLGFSAEPGGVERALSRGVILLAGRTLTPGISGQTREMPKLLGLGSIQALSSNPGSVDRLITRGLLVTDSNGWVRSSGPVARAMPRLLWPVTIRALFVIDTEPGEPAIYEIIGPYGADEFYGPDDDDAEVLGPMDRAHVVVGPYGTIYAIHIIGPKGGNDA